jgi:hypothetical protein
MVAESTAAAGHCHCQPLLTLFAIAVTVIIVIVVVSFQPQLPLPPLLQIDLKVEKSRRAQQLSYDSCLHRFLYSQKLNGKKRKKKCLCVPQTHRELCPAVRAYCGHPGGQLGVDSGSLPSQYIPTLQSSVKFWQTSSTHTSRSRPTAATAATWTKSNAPKMMPMHGRKGQSRLR